MKSNPVIFGDPSSSVKSFITANLGPNNETTRPSALGMSDPVMVLVRFALVYLFLIVVRVEEVTFYGKRGHLVQSVERMEPL